MAETTTWWRITWMEAVWASDLKPLQKLVAAVYADHARDQRTTWVTLDRLTQRSGASRTTAQKVRRELVQAGWLIEVSAATQHKAAVFGLVIPDDVSMPARGTLSDARVPGDGTLEDPRVPPRDLRVPSRDARVPGDGTNQSSIKELHPSSSSSPARTTAARLLGWAEEDDRLDHLDAFLASRNVGKALPWLKATHQAGDLERIFTAFVDGEQNPVWGTDPSASWDRPDPSESLWAQLKEETGDMASAERAVAVEARAMGRQESDPVVLRSALMTLQNERKWTA